MLGRRAGKESLAGSSLTVRGDIPSLCYRENNGALRICILDSEIERFLAAAHENHGHFAAELSLDILIGRAY